MAASDEFRGVSVSDKKMGDKKMGIHFSVSVFLSHHSLELQRPFDAGVSGYPVVSLDSGESSYGCFSSTGAMILDACLRLWWIVFVAKTASIGNSSVAGFPV